MLSYIVKKLLKNILFLVISSIFYWLFQPLCYYLLSYLKKKTIHITQVYGPEIIFFLLCIVISLCLGACRHLNNSPRALTLFASVLLKVSIQNTMFFFLLDIFVKPSAHHKLLSNPAYLSLAIKLNFRFVKR